jgi:HSP20 family molecular chaperone IbpA
MAEKTVASTGIEKRASAGEEVMKTRDEERYMSPPVDIFETDDSLMVVADLPGVKKSDLDIRVDEGILTIKGKTSYDRPSNLLRGEFDLLNHYRQFKLSEDIDQEKISAELNQGVLTINLPKAEKAQPKQIAVKVE